MMAMTVISFLFYLFYDIKQEPNAINSCDVPSPYRRAMEKLMAEAEEPPLSI